MTSERPSISGSLPRLIIPQAGGEQDERELAPAPLETDPFLKLLARIVLRMLQQRRHYAVDIVCPKCGEKHRLPKGVWLDDGPESTGSLGDYCVSQERVPSIVSLLEEKVWCEAEGRWVRQKDCNQVFLTAKEPSR